MDVGAVGEGEEAGVEQADDEAGGEGGQEDGQGPGPGGDFGEEDGDQDAWGWRGEGQGGREGRKEVLNMGQEEG